MAYNGRPSSDSTSYSETRTQDASEGDNDERNINSGSKSSGDSEAQELLPVKLENDEGISSQELQDARDDAKDYEDYLNGVSFITALELEVEDTQFNNNHG